jgi:membrane-bound lytic murein transglycosylase MltF
MKRSLCSPGALFVTLLCLLAPAAQGGQEPSPDLLRALAKNWTGDLDGMVKRQFIRVLVVYSKTYYFLDRGSEHGITYEAFKLFEDYINKQPAVRKRLEARDLRVNVVFLPVERDQLIPALREGRGDIAAAFLTITPERERLVDYSDPVLGGIEEIVVTGPGAPSIGKLDDLSDQEVFVRKSSSYYESLQRLNAAFAKAGKAPVRVRLVPEDLEDEDVLEMASAELLPIVVVDNRVAEFWKQIFPNLSLHPDVTLRTGGEIGWMLRKGSPQLKAALNEFIRRRDRGGREAAIILAEYMKNTRWVKNASSESELQKFRRVLRFFKKYGEQYDMDYLLMMAQGYQESTLDQSVRSPVGAIGVMQLMPATGAAMQVGDIAETEPNIHAGVKYVRTMIDRYFKDEPMDRVNKMLFAFASYNAGPGRVGELRREAAERGLNPNRWFNNVEIVAARRIGGQTVQYVSNIYKYYIAYKLIAEAEEERAKAMEDLRSH